MRCFLCGQSVVPADDDTYHGHVVFVNKTMTEVSQSMPNGMHAHGACARGLSKPQRRGRPIETLKSL